MLVWVEKIYKRLLKIIVVNNTNRLEVLIIKNTKRAVIGGKGKRWDKDVKAET